MLAVRHYPCLLEPSLSAAPLVLLHGWGQDSSSWLPILTELQKIAPVVTIDLPGFGGSVPPASYDLENILNTIVAQLPDKSILLGWSLGGMLSVQLAARFPHRVLGVVTLAANAKFVASRDYAAAMPASTNRQFLRNFAAEPEATLKIFGSLIMQGDPQERQRLKQWRALPGVVVSPSWLAALELLAHLDNRSVFAQLTQPGLHLLAAQDALVPAVAAEQLRELNPQQQVKLLPQCSHTLHWSQPDVVMQELKIFLLGIADARAVPAVTIDKQKIAQSFSRAAKSYDEVAGLQRAIGEKLMLQLPVELQAGACVLDLGSGTGFFTRHLAQRFAQQHVIGMDIAQGMLQHAAQLTDAVSSNKENIQWLCGDAENLPLADNSLDLIYSSLAIQWCHQLPQLMRELQRALKPGGRLLLATLGPRTLHELKTAWQQVDQYVHVNRFQPVASLADVARVAGLVECEFEQEMRVLHFERLQDLTRELKALGAHNMNSGKPAGLTGRARIEAFKAAYEQLRSKRGLPATYEVIYFAATKARELL